MMIKLRPHHVEIIIKEFKDNFRKSEAWMFYHSTACPEELHWLTNPFYTGETFRRMVSLLKQLKYEDKIKVTLNPEEDDLCKLCDNFNRRQECRIVEGEERYCEKYKIEVGKSYTIRDLLLRAGFD